MHFGTFNLLQCPEWQTEQQAFKNALEQIEYAEQLGFDSVWLVEHHFSRYSINADALLLAANVAARTKRVRIGLAVAVLPFHNPVRLAEQAAMVDILSNGRLDMGMGRGYQQQEFDRFGIPIAESRDRFIECLDIMLKAWSPGQFSYQGKYWKVPPTEVFPKPVQKPHPPLYVATSGTKDTVEWIAQKGYRMMRGGAFTEPESVKQRHDQYVDLRRAAGHKEADVQRDILGSPLSRKIYVSETSEEAQHLPAKHVMWFQQALLREALPADPKALDLPQYAYHRANMAKRAQETWDTVFQQDIYGTVDECVRKIKVFQGTGVETMALWFDYGGMDQQKVLKSMERFAKHVMPVFKKEAVPAGR